MNRLRWNQAHWRRAGFTLVEIAVVVLLIGLLATLAIPAFAKARRDAAISAVANDLRVYGDAFNLYSLENRGYPPDSHLPAPYHLPNLLIEQYIDGETWARRTPLGGYYNWEGPDFYPYAGISLFETTADLDTLRRLDEQIDDGNFLTGSFRRTPNGRYTYILDE